MSFKPRKAQREILEYEGGELAISAVPGAGKTTSLVLLATKLVVEDGVRPSQLLILTYTRSAAANIRERIRKALAAKGISAHGLKAQTIHGFCHELLSRRAGRLGFHNGFQVLTEGEQEPILQEALQRFMDAPDCREDFLRSHGLDPAAASAEQMIEAEKVSRKAAKKAITVIKNLKVNIDEACAALSEAGFMELPSMIRLYESERIRRGMLDYDDLIMLMNQLLEDDESVLRSLQRRFKFVLEDEAQDSTPGQKLIIDKLVGEHHNLIRVGDSNQSIYATFTMNSPEFFREFCKTARRVDMCESSRSCDAILDLANKLVELSADQYPQAFEKNLIVPAEDGSNPESHPRAIDWKGYGKKDEETEYVTRGVQACHGRKVDDRFLTQAILVAQNSHATNYIRALEALGIPVAEGGAQGQAAQMVSEMVFRLLKFLTLDPKDFQYRVDLADAHLAQVRYTDNIYPDRLKEREERLKKTLKNREPDWRRLLSPAGFLDAPVPAGIPCSEWKEWLAFVKQAGSLLDRRHVSPVDLVAAIAAAFFQEPYQLSVAQSFALIVRRILYHNPEYRLREVVKELESAWRSNNYNERLFPSTLEEIARDKTTEAEAKEPEPVRILTLHSSKGLEFDVVWIPGLNNRHDFPWRPEHARVTDERVLKVEKVIEAVERGESQLQDELEQSARVAQVEERLRLLYVGITRAQRFLRLSYCDSDWYRKKKELHHLNAADHIHRLKEVTT